MGEKKENKRSILLNNDENEIIVSMLGHKCQTLATAVVQLMVALPESRGRWTKKTTGVACFVKDNPKRSYFIRVYDIMVGCMIWEQELYTSFKYNAVRPFFHTFAADKYNAGLNFASEEEARMFKQPILALLRRNEAKKRKREEDRKNQKNRQTPGPQGSGNGTSNGDRIDGKRSHGAVKKRKRKITKEDIGEPEDFKHIEHIGWNPEAGFSVNVDFQDEKWKTLLNEVGITKQQLNQKSTREFIYDFVQKQGGIEEVTKKIQNERPQGPPPPPPSRVPAQPDRSAPPPPPPRGVPQPDRSAPPPPPPARRSMGTLPPPPPLRDARPPPPPRGTTLPMGSALLPPPPPPPDMDAPPPPPPPILGGSSGAPPPPPPIASGGRGDLLMQIQRGKTLKSVGEEGRRKSNAGDRSDLLNEIQKGTTLKKVSQVDGPKPAAEAGGILGALQLALAKRDTAIHSSGDDDTDSEYDSDEDEWE